MKTFKPLQDKYIVELLKKHNLFDYASLKDKHTKDIVHPEDKDVVPFVIELLLNVLPIQAIKDVYYGIGEYNEGLTTQYAYAQIDNVMELYIKLKRKFPLYEIGFKRCDVNHIQSIIEKEYDTKFKKIGTCTKFGGKITYNLLEEPKHGVLLSITNQDSYTGLIGVGFDLIYEIAKRMHSELDSSEIEFPINGYGAITIRDFTSEKPRDTKIETSKTPKVKLHLDKWLEKNS